MWILVWAAAAMAAPAQPQGSPLREEDHHFPQPPDLRPNVRRTPDGARVEIAFPVNRPGQYRLRAATVDLAGRTSVVWTPLTVVRDGGALRLEPAARR